MGLSVKNGTHYRTADLAALIRAGIREYGDDRRYTVRVVYTRGGGTSTSGYAYYNSGSITLRVPRYRTWNFPTSGKEQYSALPPETVRDLAKTLAHEIAHTNGVRHSEMDGALKRCCRGGTDDAPTPWADGMEIRAKDAKPASSMDARIAERAEKARASLDRWERKAKAAAKWAAKWRRKVAYYERRAAAKDGAS